MRNATSSDDTRKPSKDEVELMEWMEFEERGTQPGQPTLSVPYLRHAYKSLTCQGVLIEMACNSAACPHACAHSLAHVVLNP